MSATRKPVGVIDIFAGPGGLGEGFSAFKLKDGLRPFELAVSAEMEKSAHSTLRLRAFYRLLTAKEGGVPREYDEYLEKFAHGSVGQPEQYFIDGKWKSLWKESGEEALNLTLGKSEDNKILFDRIEKVRKKYDEMILIGGPPCQAYSLVGRSRQANVADFVEKGDKKHFLYKQYLEILAKFEPSVFIMENVKGILTSRVGNREMFSAIMRDLSDPSAAMPSAAKKVGSGARYVLLPIHVDEGQLRTSELVESDPSAFVVRCENHGVAQARHRVIIMGVREDLMNSQVARLPGLNEVDRVSTLNALEGLPKLRSGLSRREDSAEEWREAVELERNRVVGLLGKSLSAVADELKAQNFLYYLPRRSIQYSEKSNNYVDALRRKEQRVVLNHETRGHMPSDLGRYMFCAAFAKIYKSSPGSLEFPKKMAPDHANWDSGAFADRFRVQLKDRPANTVTSHLSKDGHAFIHWDARQCRSLTVREAARLQSFPDDYLFLGNRTQQYVQVGNAVPPLIARQIARVVWSILRK